MKSYTDIEQSKKLSEILPPESADMCFYYKEDIPQLVPFTKHNNRFYIPCWSLAALLDYLKSKAFFEIEIADSFRIETDYYDYGEGKIVHPILSVMYESEDFVDACYEMIIKLHEEELL